DRARLLVRLGMANIHRLSGKVQGIEIEDWINTTDLQDWVKIEDSSGQFRKRPVIIVNYFREEFRQRLAGAKQILDERIDILATVKGNPASIGHPLILFAIKRWVEMIRNHRALASKNVDPASTEKYTVAKEHLNNLWSALIEGAEERA